MQITLPKGDKNAQPSPGAAMRNEEPALLIIHVFKPKEVSRSTPFNTRRCTPIIDEKTVTKKKESTPVAVSFSISLEPRRI